MFDFLKNLLRRSQEDSAHSEPARTPAPRAPRHYAEPSAPPAGTAPSAQNFQNGKGVELPLQNIINSLPLELQPRVRMNRTGDMTITVPLEKVLAQLSRGAVKISFGELRQAVPEVFTSENDRDRVLVALPLSDILARLSPALIARRRVQRQVQVPAEIASPFDGDGNGLVFSMAAGKTEAHAAPAPARPTAAPPMAPKSPSRGALGSAPAPAAPAAMPPSPSQRISLRSAPTPPPPSFTPSTPSVPAAQAAPPAPIPFKAPSAPRPPATPRPGAIPMPGLRAKEAPATPAQPDSTAFHTRPAPPARPIPRPEPPATPRVAPPQAAPASPRPQFAPVSQAPVPAAPSAPPTFNPPSPVAAPPVTPPAAPARPVSAPDPLIVSLASLADLWPDPIRNEVVSMNLVDAKVALPVTAAEQGLKQGRIAFSWKTIRSWVKPAVAQSASAHDGTVLELPLKVVAPLFLARQKDAAKPQQKVSIDEDIPNLFFGFPQAEGTTTAQGTARPADTNFYVWDDAHDMVKVHEAETKRGPTPGTKFVAKYATPNEVVSRAASLEGVSGALIALPDGLMVANRLPPDVNPDTLAAFLPQIFGKVSQCTKELRMGDLNNLNFTVGNVPWKIFRVNSIFFAAFGRAGEPLPTAQLAALAGELNHNPR